MVKRVRVISEGKRRTPVQEIENIKKALADLDYRLESTGEMSSELWCSLYDAQQSLEQAITLMADYGRE